MSSEADSDNIDFNNFSYEQLMKGEGLSLGSPSPNLEIYIGYTLNHPRTTTFVNALANEQKALYRKALDNMYMPLNIQSHVHTFEFCKSGQVHLHGYVKYVVTSSGSLIGFLSDFVKTILRNMGKKKGCIIGFNEKCLHHHLSRYYSPFITAQIYPDRDSFNKWIEYCHKELYNKY